MTYDEWNDLIAGHFFNPGQAGNRVRLNLTRQILDRLGEPFGVNSDDFLRACREGSRVYFPPKPFNACHHALGLRDYWRERNKTSEPLKYPPWIGYLGLFVLAASSGHYNANTYYARLWECLGIPNGTGMYPNFQAMDELWEQLETWANVRKREELGAFRLVHLGEMAHVSLPLGQAILTEEERERLPQIFARCEFAPGIAVPRSELRSAFRSCGKDVLEARTLRVLDEDSELADDLLSDIEESLQGWDGVETLSQTENAAVASGQRRLSGRLLKLFFRLEGQLARVQVRFFGVAPDAAPDEDERITFVLERTQGTGPQRLLANGFVGWSAPLTMEDGAIFDASQLDWRIEHRWRSDDGPRRVLFPCVGVRLFVRATRHDLPGWIEADELPYGGHCVVAASANELEKTRTWLGVLPRGSWRALPLAGFPSDWSLFQIDKVPIEPSLRVGFPLAAQPPQVRLRREGGIKVGRGGSRTYFDFAPPRFRLEGDPTGVVVKANGDLLHMNDEGGIVTLPSGMALGSVEVEAVRDDNQLAMERIYLQGTEIWSGNPTTMRLVLGPDGTTPAADDKGVTGAWVEGTDLSPFDFSRLQSESDSQKVYLLGAEPGQIACRPSDPIPPWEAVWVVRLGKHPKIALADAGMVPPQPTKEANPAAIKDWRGFFFHNRRKLSIPAHHPLGPLWAEYQRQARHG
jgi:hypothetical protein